MTFPPITEKDILDGDVLREWLVILNKNPDAYLVHGTLVREVLKLRAELAAALEGVDSQRRGIARAEDRESQALSDVETARAWARMWKALARRHWRKRR